MREASLVWPRASSVTDGVDINPLEPGRARMALHLTTKLVDQPQRDDVVGVREILDWAGHAGIGWEFLAQGTQEHAPALGTDRRVTKLSGDPTHAGRPGSAVAGCGVHIALPCPRFRTRTFSRRGYGRIGAHPERRRGSPVGCLRGNTQRGTRTEPAIAAGLIDRRTLHQTGDGRPKTHDQTCYAGSSNKPPAIAWRTISARDAARSLVMMCARWLSTVRTLT